MHTSLHIRGTKQKKKKKFLTSWNLLFCSARVEKNKQNEFMHYVVY